MFSLNEIFDIYNQFLAAFPESARPWISLALAVLIAFGIYKIVKRQFVYLILLIILLPASVPILKNVWEAALEIIRFLINRP